MVSNWATQITLINFEFSLVTFQQVIFESARLMQRSNQAQRMSVVGNGAKQKMQNS